MPSQRQPQLSAPPAINFNSELALPADDPSIKRLIGPKPRLLSFSHRNISSLRHPRLAEIAEGTGLGLGAGAGAGQRTAQNSRYTRAELLDPLHNPEYTQRQEEKWTAIGEVYDLLLTKEHLVRRRADALVHPALRSVVDRFWSRYCTPGAAAVLERTYREANLLFYHLLYATDPQLALVARDAITADWEFDRHGGTGVSYGWMFVSLFELADNWLEPPDKRSASAPTPPGVVHAQWLERLLERVIAHDALKRTTATESGSQPQQQQQRVEEASGSDSAWQRKRDQVLRSFNKYRERGEHRFVLPIVATRPASGFVEYVPHVIPTMETMNKAHERGSRSVP